jgi:hypothetical protein
MLSKRYSIPNRLADVLALIQVLALDTYTHRSEKGIQKELQGCPRSANTWGTLALEHPEFFRVAKDQELSISLVARHVSGEASMQQLDVSFIGKLLGAAIELHDREENRRVGWRSILMPLVGVVLGGVLAIGTSYYSEKIQFENQVGLQLDRDAKAVYSRLLGRRFVTKQLYVSRYEAFIFSDFHEARWKLKGAPKNSLDLQEALRWMHRSEDLVFEITKSHQALFEDIGTVRATFPDTKELRELTKRLLELKAINTAKPPKGADAAALEKWKVETVKQLQALVDSEFGKRFDELLDFLTQQLPLKR